MAMDSGSPPPPPCLSGRFQDSFAFVTLSQRLPVILTRVIDLLCRERTVLAERGKQAGEDAQVVARELSQLKYQMQTDKMLTLIEDDVTDSKKWNQILDEEKRENDGKLSWFHQPWLLVECYLYRRIFSAFHRTVELKTYDPFQASKQQALITSTPSVAALLNYANSVLSEGQLLDKKQRFMELLQVCLWGNKCDLSISSGEDNSQVNDPLEELKKLDGYIIVNDSESLWRMITGSERGLHVEWVLDNAGFEFMTDLVLADYLTETGLVSSIRFHGKKIPWFVSDVTAEDFDFTLKWMMASSDSLFKDAGFRWHHNLQSGSWSFECQDFWTLPCDYSTMKRVAPDLYSNLEVSDLVIFKGDLNYRKLVGDRMWNTTTPFATSLRGFLPSRLVALRTLKADVVTGLAEGVEARLTEEGGGRSWMTNGQYAVVQFC